MNYVSIGDQSQSFQTRRQNVRLKAEMQRLSQELASGRKSRPAAETSGDTSHILSIGRSLTALGGYRTTTAEAQVFVDIAQTALATVQSTADTTSSGLFAAAASRNATQLGTAAKDAEAKFASVVSALNANAAGKSLFGGTATDRPPLADADTIMTALRTAVGAQPTVSGIKAIVDNWFDSPGGGFETAGYLGSTTGKVNFRIGDGEDATLSLTASSTELRSVLKSFALGALVNAPGLSGDVAAQADLAKTAGESMLADQMGLSNARAGIGAMQARLDAADTRHSAEKSALEIAENKLTVADPYDTATAFEQVQTQLETHYQVTARLAGLTLTNYLR